MSGNLRFQLLTDVRAGEELEYYRGHLAVDRDEYAAADAIAKGAWAAYEEGLVSLVQRRLGPNNFSYVAVRR